MAKKGDSIMIHTDCFNQRAERSRKARVSFVLFCVLLLLGSAHLRTLGSNDQAFGAGGVNLVLRDSSDGKRIRGAIVAVRSFDGFVRRSFADAAGKAAAESRGRTEIDIQAEGYKPLGTYFIIDGDQLEATIYLDPVGFAAAYEARGVDSLETTSGTVFSGFLYYKDGSPIHMATLTVDGLEGTALSDEKGYFELHVATPPVVLARDKPGEGTLRIKKDGRLIYVRDNVQIPPGRVQLIIDAATDGPAVTVDAKHKLSMDRETLANTQNWGSRAEEPILFGFRPEAVAVPQSIRVGSSCPSGRTSCTVFTVYSIDAYTRFGLDDEWIGSWNANSLKAGAIAFRSYGAYHVNHPINAANYDICNTTSCQVCDPTDTFPATNTAVNQTTGSVVVNAAGTDIFFSEYSAENNLGGCPDGFTGNNTTWPCLADPVDTGQAFFGHGRGMCQWGSQRWSINQGKDFVWIVNHYYNANGNPAGLRNGVLQMGPDTIPPPPTIIGPGTAAAPGSTVTTLTPTFAWVPMNGADGYGLYISKFNGSTYDLVFNSETAVGQPIAGTSFTLPSGVLVAGGQYRWNLSSHIPAGYGTANTFRSYFTVNPSATISGKVMTPAGLAIRNAVVSIVDDQGVRRTATTSSFGIYTFTGVAIGRSHTLTVASKRYRFAPKVVQVNGDLANEDFVGLE